MALKGRHDNYNFLSLFEKDRRERIGKLLSPSCSLVVVVVSPSWPVSQFIH